MEDARKRTDLAEAADPLRFSLEVNDPFLLKAVSGTSDTPWSSVTTSGGLCEPRDLAELVLLWGEWEACRLGGALLLGEVFRFGLPFFAFSDLDDFGLDRLVLAEVLDLAEFSLTDFPNLSDLTDFTDFPDLADLTECPDLLDWIDFAEWLESLDTADTSDWSEVEDRDEWRPW